MDEEQQARARVEYLSRRVAALRTEEKSLPYERADWRRVRRELAHVEEALAQAQREAELAAEWVNIDWAFLSGKSPTSDEIALARRRAFRVIPGGRGVRPRS